MTPRHFLLLLRTLFKFRPSSLARVGLYRLKLMLGILRRNLPLGSAYAGPFLSQSIVDAGPMAKTTIDHAAFSRQLVLLPPAGGWHTDCLGGGRPVANAGRHWSLIPDFDAEVGDIKLIWECSRFDWLPRQAWLSRCRPEPTVAAMDAIVADWVRANPFNTGPNWKCGQETGLRLINFLVARRIIGETVAPTDAAIRFVREHVERIIPSVDYAIGQDNNHAISEAVALMMAGLWLTNHQRTDGGLGERSQALVERLALRLFLPDGVFSQYSIVYHRMALTLCALAELERRYACAPAFGTAFYERMAAATRWLALLTDPDSGDAPNFGANDGTNLLNIGGAEYRDFRPAADLASAVFCGTTLFNTHPLLELFGVAVPLAAPEGDALLHCPDGGMVAMRAGSLLIMLRVPNFVFRPAHADGLHLDLWFAGRNLLRDGGSYSYAAGERHRHYTGTACHNTVCFDGSDQMPRLGRFLFGDWLSATVPPPIEQDGIVRLEGAYRTAAGASHVRVVTIDRAAQRLEVIDDVSGFVREATLRWRLPPGPLKLVNNGFEAEGVSLTIDGAMSVSVTEGSESLHYLEEDEIPVVEATRTLPGRFATRVSFGQGV